MCPCAAYIHVYGHDAQLHLARRISELESRHSEMLGRLPADFQRNFHSRRKQAAAEPGAEKWVFPQPILDEEAFRERMVAEGSDTDSGV